MLTSANSVSPMPTTIPQIHSTAAATPEFLPSTAATAPAELMKKQKFELSIADEAIVNILEKINRQLAGISTEVKYSLHRQDGQIVIRIVNSDTKEVLKEIPPEKILDMLDKFREINRPAGVIIDEKR